MFAYQPDIPKILLVDHNLPNLARIKEIVHSLDLEIFIARSADETMERINAVDFDMVIVDTELNDINVYDLCKSIRKLSQGNDFAVLFISSRGAYEDKSKGFESGADDYLEKPLYPQEVRARLQLHLKKRRAIKQLKMLLKRSYHELYNPLSVIKTSAEMYGYQYPKNRYVDTMYAAAKSLHLIYEDLYYSLGSTKSLPVAEEIDISHFLRKRVEYFDLIASVKNIRLVLEADEVCSVHIAETDLQRVIDNTISNAIKYSFENSIIRIALRTKSRPKLSITNHGNTIINPQYIFTEGYRESYNTIGMGIGLEIVASICKRMNIDTKVLSSKGITTFTYTFRGKTTYENYPF